MAMEIVAWGLTYFDQFTNRHEITVLLPNPFVEILKRQLHSHDSGHESQ